MTTPTYTNIHHVALTVSDADASAAWYCDLLDLSEVLRGDDEGVSFRVLAGSGVVIGVRQYRAHPADRFSEFRTGLDHLAIGVPTRAELEAWQARLEERDIVFSPIAETPIGSVIVFRDPDGIQLEFWLPAA